LPRYGEMLRVHSSLLIPNSSFFCAAVFTDAAVFFLRYIEAIIAYPSVADGAEVKMQMSFQIRTVKGGAVFVSPQHIQRVLVFYDGAVFACKRM